MVFTDLREWSTWFYKVLITGLERPFGSPTGKTPSGQCCPVSDLGEFWVWAKYNYHLQHIPTSTGAIINFLKSTASLTDQRKVISSTDQSGTWAWANHKILGPNFNQYVHSPLTPQRAQGLSNGYSAPYSLIYNKDLLCSTTWCGDWLSAHQVSRPSLGVLRSCL